MDLGGRLKVNLMQTHHICSAPDTFVSRKAISELTGMSPKTVQRLIEEFAIVPIDFERNAAIYNIHEIEEAMDKRLKNRIASFKRKRKRTGIVTLSELKRVRKKAVRK